MLQLIKISPVGLGRFCVYFSVLISGAIISPALWAGKLDLSVSDDAAQIKFESAFDITDIYFSGGLSSFDNEENIVDVDGTSGFVGLALTEAIDGKSRVGLGVRLNKFSIDVNTPGDIDIEGGALGIGGFAHLYLPSNEKLRFRAEAYYAPDAITYDDVTKFSEFSIQFEYNVIQNAVVTLGFRDVSVEVIDEDLDIEDDVFFGIRIEF